MAGGDEYHMFQSNHTVYHDDYADYSTNEPTMDGTADLTYYLSAMQQESKADAKPNNELEYSYGAIIRGDTTRKQITLVFTGHDLADGFKRVRSLLNAHNIKASFFLTGDFYRNRSFSGMIKAIRKDGHYLGAHSDKHLLYCDWNKRDSLLVDKTAFLADLRANYAAMGCYKIQPEEARFFLPPYEWYNDSIAAWCNQYGLTLVNFTPGTSSNQDWTYPGFGSQYISSESIYHRILNYEKETPGRLNGFILLTHFGTDPRRPDKFYDRLDDLITELERRGYGFATLEEMIE
jgi:peptidoglycan/xylan/chitin deacetylase (PgdA/CDA1 family)